MHATGEFFLLHLPYSEIREQIGNGDILLFRGSHLYSKIIKLRTLSVYSHVGIAHWIKSDGVRRLAVCESREGQGVRLYPLRKYLEQNTWVDWFAVTDEIVNRDRVVAWAMSRWGNDYASVWQMLRSFGLITRKVSRWLGLKSRVDQDRYFCSWFAASALRHAGWEPGESEFKPEQVSPGEIALFPGLQMKGRIVLDEGSKNEVGSLRMERGS